jgi:hypothetical protein
MKLFPHQAYIINTTLTTNEVNKKLKQVVGEKKAFRSPLKSKKNDKFFEGEVTASSFVISRVIYYQNSFKPVVKGSYKSVEGGTEIIITMSLPKMIVAFIVFWCVFDVFLILLGAAEMYVNGGFSFLVGLGAISLVLPFVGIKLGYPKEAAEVKSAFNQLFR